MRLLFICVVLFFTNTLGPVVAAAKERTLDDLPVDEQIQLVEDSTLPVSAGDLSPLIQQINTQGKGIPVVVYNTLSWNRTDVIEMNSPYPGQGGYFAVRDSHGRVYPARNIGDRLCFTARDVPALGYKVFWIIRTIAPVPTGISCSGTTLENQYYKVVIDPKGGFISQIYDKIRGRNVLGSNGRGAELQMMIQKPVAKADVVLGAPGEKLEVKDLQGYGEVVIMDSGPARATISFDRKYKTSYFVQDLSLYDCVDRIDVHLTTDWKEASTKPISTLAVTLAAAMKSGRVNFAIPCRSAVQAAESYGNPGVRWVDISDGEFGTSLLAESISTYEAVNGVLRASLLESVDESAQKGVDGTREVNYSIYSHKGDWRFGTVRRAFELDEPLIAYIDKSHSGGLPPSKSLLSVSAPKGVAVKAKCLEQGGGLSLAVYEATGNTGGKVTVRLDIPAKDIVETDARGNVIGQKIEIKNGEFSIDIARYQMKFFRLSL